MERLSLSTLPLVDDGSIAHVFDKALRECYLDCDDRPALVKDRSITLKITMKPHEASEELRFVQASFEVKTSIPGKGTTQVFKPIARDRSLGFETDTRDVDHDPDQSTLPYSSEE